MELAVVSGQDGAGGGSVAVSDEAFGAPLNEGLVHQVVTAYMAAARSGTKAQKTRSEVSGGGAKPWRQKGTGRARVGSSRNPIWRGGGVTFAAKPRNYAQKVNRKMYRAALRVIVSELHRQERLVICDDFSLSAPKTKEAVGKLSAMGLNDVLIVTTDGGENTNLELATRNLHWVAVVSASDVNPVTLLAFEKVLMTSDAVKAVEERIK